MNENQEIFTAEQFRAQAVELSQAVAELHRRDSQRIDPHNPFENETEFHEYQPDYAEIVPQIRIPGCRIPLKANSREKSRIRRYFNIVGGFLLAHLVISNVLAVGLEEVCLLLLRLVDGMATDLPEGYDQMALDYFNNSSSLIAMNLLIFMLANLLVFWIGCRTTKISVPNLFRTTNFGAVTAFSYVCIALLIQLVTGYAAMGLDTLFEGIGVQLYEPDLSGSGDLKSSILSVIYSVLIAPVTEELLMRGFVLKNLSRVSQRFGIVMSAFLFGIWHENVAQFILAFIGGMFFGYIAVKHNSLVPSIICHMAVNGFAEIVTLCEDHGWDVASTVANIIYMGLVLVGIVMLIRMFIVERFPRTTPSQAERGLRQVLVSPLMMLVIVCHIGVAVIAIAFNPML
ncbi:MAG: CPBP family intramembrane metalloprotease [Oscillospiraceae bacterium]|nr:CPBP family intramembrane metalloprotease [Oscillospiraceae bacterium]